MTVNPELVKVYREMRASGTYEAMEAQSALRWARSTLKRRTLGLAPEDFDYVGSALYGEDVNVVYRADIPMTNGHTLAVLVKCDPESSYTDEPEGTFTNDMSYDYYRRGLSTTGPRRLRDALILSSREREYRESNEGAPSGGHSWRDTWGMYYEPQEGCDHLSNARYFHKRGMARHAAWTAGMRMERATERYDAGDKSYYYLELREMTPEGGDVVLWEDRCGIALDENMSSRDEKNYLADEAYDLMSDELKALLLPTRSAVR